MPQSALLQDYLTFQTVVMRTPYCARGIHWDTINDSLKFGIRYAPLIVDESANIPQPQDGDYHPQL